MDKFSKRIDAIQNIKILGAVEAVLFLLKEQAEHGETSLLSCNPRDPNLIEKITQAQTLRNLYLSLKKDLK